jgi:hypothetical protein
MLMRMSLFEMNKPLESEVYDPCTQTHDSLAHAALCRSSACFRYLQMKGCDRSNGDGKHGAIGHFAPIAGALDITRQIDQDKWASDGLAQIVMK